MALNCRVPAGGGGVGGPEGPVRPDLGADGFGVGLVSTKGDITKENKQSLRPILIANRYKENKRI